MTIGLIANVLSGATQQGQLLMVAGFVMLGWVLARRQLGLRKRVKRNARASHKAVQKVRDYKEPAVPLSDAPVETLRWQGAMFDLQRELKAELDTRIVVVQTLLRQVDERIERLELLGSASPTIHVTRSNQIAVEKLLRDGHTAKEIAVETGLPLGDVEFAIATMAPSAFHRS